MLSLSTPRPLQQQKTMSITSWTLSALAREIMLSSKRNVRSCDRLIAALDLKLKSDFRVVSPLNARAHNHSHFGRSRDLNWISIETLPASSMKQRTRKRRTRKKRIKIGSNWLRGSIGKKFAVTRNGDKDEDFVIPSARETYNCSKLG